MQRHGIEFPMLPPIGNGTRLLIQQSANLAHNWRDTIVLRGICRQLMIIKLSLFGRLKKMTSTIPTALNLAQNLLLKRFNIATSSAGVRLNAIQTNPYKLFYEKDL
jgi:hypothetical protein